MVPVIFHRLNILISVSALLIFIFVSEAGAQIPHRIKPGREFLDTLQTLPEYIKEHLWELAPPEYKKQQNVMRTFQKRGYGNILLELSDGDGLGMLIAFLRTKLHIEYSMFHRTYWIIPPDPRGAYPGIPFPEDRRFVADPWEVRK